jgi:hypothetical protein
MLFLLNTGDKRVVGEGMHGRPLASQKGDWPYPPS